MKAGDVEFQLAGGADAPSGKQDYIRDDMFAGSELEQTLALGYGMSAARPKNFIQLEKGLPMNRNPKFLLSAPCLFDGPDDESLCLGAG